MSRVEPLKASNDSYLRQLNLRAASGAATSASVALESASALRRSSDATSVSSRGAKRMEMVDFLLTKACKSVFAVTFPTQIRYLPESENRHSGLICGCNPLSLQV